jgi:glycosyltransferase involved in cell wall biosynthesis
MHVLFIHRAFPAQFGRLGLELSRRHGWKCSFLIEHLSRCPTPSPEMLAELTLYSLPRAADAGPPPWPQRYGEALQRGERLAEAVRAQADLRPDLVVGHGGLVPTLLLRDVLDCPIVDFCEYYFAPSRRDLTYRIDLPPAEPAPFFPRCINAATLVNMLACDAAFAPTEWQRRSFPRRFWDRIEVLPDGVDTDLYCPGEPPATLGGVSIPPEMRVVTFAARGLESVRGFDLFARVAAGILKRRQDVLFVAAGEDEAYYGWDKSAVPGSFRDAALERAGVDRSRFLFLGQVEPPRLAEMFRRSNLHLYCSVPFVASWSLLDALACGCVVLGPDDDAVREFIEPGRTGLLAPLFDADAWVETALRVLADPAAYRSPAAAASQAVVARHSLEGVVPRVRAFLERVRSLHGGGLRSHG